MGDRTEPMNAWRGKREIHDRRAEFPRRREEGLAMLPQAAVTAVSGMV